MLTSFLGPSELPGLFLIVGRFDMELLNRHAGHSVCVGGHYPLKHARVPEHHVSSCGKHSCDITPVPDKD